MSKYQGLSDHLSGQKGNEWRGGFDEVEQLLGAPLPKTARTGVAWWANDPAKAQSKAWLGAGWQVMDVDTKAGTVTFLKADAAKPAKKKAPAKAAAAPKSAAPTAEPKRKAAPKAAAKAAAKPQVAPEPAPAADAAPQPQPFAAGKLASDEPDFLQRLPGGNKTAVAGGIAAAVLGVGALIARAFMRKR
ncbi:DUF7662 domain-containing protein [Phenylobacterium sp.]|jgi:hypothetical protein|uniref:DUF7662 domain-containing protein n=1 Tax=Phenylobacterium sp. TaxID=1871053 RepID=UPI002E312CD2|nr:hypothetical protein [Phenylobacterium sp.]HEX2560123.1 hypothetical protein [Phenylobacterium sp.]